MNRLNELFKEFLGDTEISVQGYKLGDFGMIELGEGELPKELRELINGGDSRVVRYKASELPKEIQDLLSGKRTYEKNKTDIEKGGDMKGKHTNKLIERIMDRINDDIEENEGMYWQEAWELAEENGYKSIKNLVDDNIIELEKFKNKKYKLKLEDILPKVWIPNKEVDLYFFYHAREMMKEGRFMSILGSPEGTYYYMDGDYTIKSSNQKPCIRLEDLNNKVWFEVKK